MVVSRFAVGQLAWAVEAKRGEAGCKAHPRRKLWRDVSLEPPPFYAEKKARWTLPPTWPILLVDAFYLAVVVAAVAFAGFFDAVAGFAAAGAGTAVA